MKPFRTLAETITPDGARFTLHEHDGDHFMKLNGRQLMSTTSTTSEILLAKLACENLSRHPHPRVLIGALGLGFLVEGRAFDRGKKSGGSRSGTAAGGGRVKSAVPDEGKRRAPERPPGKSFQRGCFRLI